jgi:membrane protease YdiL (CAAX protease family)
VFCTSCGASTAHTDARARPSASGAAFQLTSEDAGLPASHREVLPPIDPPTDGRARKLLRWETVFVMVAFLVPSVVAAVVLLAQHVVGVGGITRFPDFVTGQPVTNMLLGILAYLPVMAAVPLALLLLARTGQTPSALGLGLPSFGNDVLPGLGLALAAFGAEIVVLIPLAPLIAHHPGLISKVPVGHVPAYYVIWGLAISAITAVTEEVMMNGYFLTRLEQLGWSPGRALALSLALRTSYHIYYGLAFVLTIPFGYFVTKSFQKHGRLNRPIAAHFLFDGVLITLAILR